ncbi:MAG: GGDEF domain-containing protein [Dehalococcoidia bacterium]
MTTQENPVGHPALTDTLTGLANRLHFETVFRIVFEEGDRGVPVTILLLDLDNFTEFQEQTSKARGDEVLREVGQTLNNMTRQTDLLAHMGGDRFGVLLVNCNVPGALIVADRCQMFLDDFRADSGIRFSIGIATYQKEMEVRQDLLDAAEQALKEAKAAGGDQIEIATPGLD